MAWTFEVDRKDCAVAQIVRAGDSVQIVLKEGETLLAVERVSITANNVTYARVGERLGYWRFFPVNDAASGIVPAWGFARVIRTTRPDISLGQRVYGYLPMADNLVAQLEPAGGALIDRAPHRTPMAAVYNNYAFAPDVSPHDDHRALLQPLLVTSFLIDGHLSDEAMFGAARVVLSSASSKTAMGLAWMLRQRGEVEVVGLSSTSNAAKIAGTDCYDRLLTYADTAALAVDRVKSIYVDFAGDPTLTHTLHTALAEYLVASILVGGTHWDAPTNAATLPGVAPQFFFAPEHARARIAAWGEREFHQKFSASLGAFISASPWLVIDHFKGAEGMAAAWHAALTGQTDPTHGIIVTIEG